MRLGTTRFSALVLLIIVVRGAAPAQEKPPVKPLDPTRQPAPATVSPDLQFPPDRDLSKLPLLSWDPKAVPPEPSTARLGIGGQPLRMTVNEAIRLALQNNKDIEVARDNVRLNERNLNALSGVYDPIFQLAPILSRTTSPAITTTGGSSASQTDLIVTPSLTKQFSTGGGEYQVFFNGLRRTNSSPFTLLSPIYSSNVGITFAQPLLRNRPIDLNRRNIRVQQKRLSQSDAEFRQQTIDVISRVQQAYWELAFALRDQQSKLDAVNLGREQLRMIEERIKAGLSSPLERAEAITQIETTQTNLLAATNYVTTTETALKQLLLPNSRAVEWTEAIVPIEEPKMDLEPLNLQQLVADARENRPELRLLAMQQDINAIDRKFYGNQTKPRVDLEATAATTGLAGRRNNPNGTLANGAVVSSASQLSVGNSSIQLPSLVTLSELNLPGIGGSQGVVTLPGSGVVATPQLQSLTLPGTTAVNATPGTIGSPTPVVPQNLVGGFGQQLRNLLSFNTRSVVVGLTVELPLRDRAARESLAAARVQEQQLGALVEATEDAIEADVRNAAQTVETTRRQVLSARAARESAEVQLEGEVKLYQTGLSTTFLVFQRQNQLSNARDTEIRAETDYAKALSLLQRATSSTLSANNVVIENPRTP